MSPSAGPFRAVVFDLDGTLLDSAPDIADALARALALEALPPVPLDEVRRMIGDGAPALMRKALAYLGADGGEARAARLLAAWQGFAAETPVRLSRLYPDMEATVRTLREAGVRLGVCTNKTESLARLILDALPIAPDIHVLVGGDGPHPPKPHPASLLATLDALGVEPAAAAYVGDMRVDWLTATAAGVPFFGVDHGLWPGTDPDLARIVPARGSADLLVRLRAGA